MEYDKIKTCYFLKIMKVNNYLNLLLENMLELIVYLKSITNINQLDLKHLCEGQILVSGETTVEADLIETGVDENRDRKNKPLILKNNGPFISCITKINNELIEDAEDLDIVMPMYNLLEYSKNYRKTIGSL